MKIDSCVLGQMIIKDTEDCASTVIFMAKEIELAPGWVILLDAELLVSYRCSPRPHDFRLEKPPGWWCVPAAAVKSLTFEPCPDLGGGS